jgi:hypothetical protein
VTQEEPYLYTDSGGSYRVFVPAVRRYSVGPSWANGATPGTSVPISKFFIATPSTPTPVIDAALALGRDLLLSPGVYNLNAPIVVSRPDTIILGLGFPTLVPQHGTPALVAAVSRGVKLSGMIIDAGPKNSPVLLQTLPGRSDPNDPTLIQDVFFRIGGATPGSATNTLAVGSSNTILDDIWAWRADHGAGVGWTANTADTGLIVTGDDVTAYGLFVEHYQKHEVVWTGQRGTDIFFQNEMPYDPPSQAAWMAGPTTNGYPAFTIGSGVTGFAGYGMASYCFFNQGVDIHATEAFAAPTTPGVELHDILTRFLNASGGIDSVVDGIGAPVTASSPGPSDVVSFP